MRELITTTPPSVASSQDQKDKHRDLEIKGASPREGRYFGRNPGENLPRIFSGIPYFLTKVAKNQIWLNLDQKLLFVKKPSQSKPRRPPCLKSKAKGKQSFAKFTWFLRLKRCWKVRSILGWPISKSCYTIIQICSVHCILSIYLCMLDQNSKAQSSNRFLLKVTWIINIFYCKLI